MYNFYFKQYTKTVHQSCFKILKAMIILKKINLILIIYTTKGT